ncbi:hypothetical protein AB0I81_01350 [Nonomuraea sp. NPDC050404]|uniref:hypothetical protein n=1 Tax=Nonomuraea sp. NPDC050404 TaxID=3155783 RepID=UPI0033D110F8
MLERSRHGTWQPASAATRAAEAPRRAGADDHDIPDVHRSRCRTRPLLLLSQLSGSPDSAEQTTLLWLVVMVTVTRLTCQSSSVPMG